MIPLGSFKKYSFSIEKKEHHLLDVVAKDMRRLRFRFESPTSYYRMSDAMARMVEITKHKDLFAFDYALKLKEQAIGRGNNLEDIKNMFITEDRVTEYALQEFKRMGVPQASKDGKQPLFSCIPLDTLTRVKFRIDLPG